MAIKRIEKPENQSKDNSKEKADELFNRLNNAKKSNDSKFVQISLRVEETALNKIKNISSLMGIGKSGGIRYAINRLIKDWENDLLP